MKNLKINSFKKYFKRFLYLLKYFISFRCSQKPINKGFKDYLKQVFTTLKQVFTTLKTSFYDFKTSFYDFKTSFYDFKNKFLRL